MEENKYILERHVSLSATKGIGCKRSEKLLESSSQ